MLSFLGQYRMVLCEFNAYTCGISIALAIRSFDPLWGFGLWWFRESTNLQDLYRTHYPFA